MKNTHLTFGASSRIQRVARKDNAAQKTLAQIKASRIFVRYKDKLKRNSIAILIYRWLWQYLYPLYANYFIIYVRNRRHSKWRRLVPLKTLRTENCISIDILAEAELIELSAARVLPSTETINFPLNSASYTFPPISVTRLSTAEIYGGTNIVLTEDSAVFHDLYDFGRDQIHEELHGNLRIDPKYNRVRWLPYDEKPEKIPIAATFVDACAVNYAHWITEVLPRICAFCKVEKFKEIPIIINDGLHKNILESLFLTVESSRKIISLPVGRGLQVDEVYITSPTGYVPFGWRSSNLDGHFHGAFSRYALNLVREQLDPIEEAVKSKMPNKIFLQRRADVRRLSNSIELETFLISEGYAIINPEDLSFLEQVRLFQNATEVIAPTGAALANAVFCRPNTRVVILIAKHNDMVYGYWLNMLSPMQLKVIYIIGVIDGHHERGVHADFSVNISDLVSLLKINSDV
jgi:capsular polysaccharide biosynthesis protein